MWPNTKKTHQALIINGREPAYVTMGVMAIGEFAKKVEISL